MRKRHGVMVVGIAILMISLPVGLEGEHQWQHGDMGLWGSFPLSSTKMFISMQPRRIEQNPVRYKCS